MSSREAELLERALAGESPAPPHLLPLLGATWTLRTTFLSRPSIRADLRARTAALAAFEGPGNTAAGREAASGGVRRRRVLRWAVAAILAVVLIPGAALAATWPLVEGSLPGDALYPLKLGVERARLMVTFGDDELDVYLDFADTRLDEAERAQELGDTEALDEALRRYDEAVLAFEATAALLGGVPERLSERVEQAFARHLIVLASLRDQVPSVAVPGIDKALELAQRQAALGGGPPSIGQPGGSVDAEDGSGGGGGSSGGSSGGKPTTPVQGEGEGPVSTGKPPPTPTGPPHGTEGPPPGTTPSPGPPPDEGSPSVPPPAP